LLVYFQDKDRILQVYKSEWGISSSNKHKSLYEHTRNKGF